MVKARDLFRVWPPSLWHLLARRTIHRIFASMYTFCFPMPTDTHSCHYGDPVWASRAGWRKHGRIIGSYYELRNGMDWFVEGLLASSHVQSYLLNVEMVQQNGASEHTCERDGVLKEADPFTLRTSAGRGRSRQTVSHICTGAVGVTSNLRDSHARAVDGNLWMAICH